MKGKVLFIYILSILFIFQLIKAEPTNTIANDDTTKSPNTSSELPNLNFGDEDLCQALKPSKAFTAVILVYFALIVIGAILVLVLVKSQIDN